MQASNFRVRDYAQNESDEADALNEHVRDPGDPDGVIAAEEERRRRQQLEQLRHTASDRPTRPPKPKKHHRLLWLFVLLVLLAVAGAVSYWLGNRAATQRQSTKSSQNATGANKSQTTTQSSKPTPSATKHYDSTTYTLGFDYPKTWQVSDTAAKLTVTSPTMQLTAASGTKTDIRVVLTIQNQQTSIAGFPGDGAVAILTSDHLNYKQPSTIQRASTYLSYLSYTSDNGLDALYITGDSGYQAGQLVPQSDVAKGNPLISATFTQCLDENCVGAKPATLKASSWQNTQPAVDVTNFIESIVLD